MDGRVGPHQWRLLCAIEELHPSPVVLALAASRAGLADHPDALRRAMAGLVDRGFVRHCMGDDPHRMAGGSLVILTDAGLAARPLDGASRYAEAVAIAEKERTG
jgi:hypothetical protein